MIKKIISGCFAILLLCNNLSNVYADFPMYDYLKCFCLDNIEKEDISELGWTEENYTFVFLQDGRSGFVLSEDLEDHTPSVVDIAMQYLGVPYRWGGTTPAGFDCSGFVQYVYKEYGIDISRTTYTQIYDGYWVDLGYLQPGDLVFFGSASSPHHVGIYIGDYQYIHAPHSGDVIKISSLKGRSDLSNARRICDTN